MPDIPLSISSQWMPEERLLLVAYLMRRIDRLTSGRLSNEGQQRITSYAEMAFYVATQDQTFLEANRQQILQTCEED